MDIIKVLLIVILVFAKVVILLVRDVLRVRTVYNVWKNFISVIKNVSLVLLIVNLAQMEKHVMIVNKVILIK